MSLSFIIYFPVLVLILKILFLKVALNTSYNKFLNVRHPSKSFFNSNSEACFAESQILSPFYAPNGSPNSSKKRAKYFVYILVP